MSLSNEYETKALKFLFTPEGTNAASGLRPASLHLGLFTSSPSDTAFGTEVSATNTNYVRQAAAFTISGNNASNTAAIEFAECGSQNYGNVAAVAILDSSTGGAPTNIIAYASLTGGAKTINTGDIFRIPAGDLDINLD